MKALTNLVLIAVILTITVLIILAGYHGMIRLWVAYMDLPLTVRAVIAAGGSFMLFSVAIIVWGFKAAAGMIARSRLSKTRYEVYVHTLMLYSHYIKAPAAIDESDYADILEELAQIEPDLLLLAGGATFQAHHELHVHIRQRSLEEETLNACFAQLLKNVRRDLGYAATYEEAKFVEGMHQVAETGRQPDSVTSIPHPA